MICYEVLTSQPEVAIIHPDSHQPQQDDNNKQENTKSGALRILILLLH